MTFEELKKYTKNLTILYVEDDDDLREEIQALLEKLFYKVTFASDGLEAKEIYEKHSYDIILSDLQLPKYNGFELSKFVLAKNPEQKIVLISGHNREDILPYMEELKLKYLLLKPLVDEKLIEVLFEVSQSIRLK